MNVPIHLPRTSRDFYENSEKQTRGSICKVNKWQNLASKKNYNRNIVQDGVRLNYKLR